MQDPTDDDKKRLALLGALSEEGFRQLDQGQGIVIADDRQLAIFIRQIGRRTDSEDQAR